MATIPSNTTALDLTGASAFVSVRDTLQAKYVDATAWAQYAATVMESKLTAINTTTDKFDVSEFIADATAAINAIPALSTLDCITIGDMPSPIMSFTNDTFSDDIVGTIKALIAAGGTGLGNATEEALFQREIQRQNTARLLAYNEVTTQYAARGFDMPPGALLAKQTELNNESNIRLSDSSSQIMAESAKLAQEWNKTNATMATQLLDVLARVFDSKLARDFEKAKSDVLASIEVCKVKISEFTANTQLQIAASDVLQKKATAVADISTKFALSQIDQAVRKYAVDLQVLQSNASAMQQMVSSALSSVHVQASMGAQSSGQTQVSAHSQVNYQVSGKPDIALPVPL